LVRRQDFPDLVLRRARDGRIFLLEVDGITKYRKRSVKQIELLTEWGIPRVKTFEEALAWLSQQ